MNMERALRAAVAAQVLRDLDLHFALQLAALAQGERDAVMLAFALVSARTGEGHVCVALDEAAGAPLFRTDAFWGIEAPTLTTWRDTLRASGVVGQPGEWKPLTLDARDRLYLTRYHRFESAIAEQLLQRARVPLLDLASATARVALDRHFPAPAAMGKRQLDLWSATEAEVDHQRLAAATALLRSLVIVAGGPGTGKTTTVTRLLALIIEQAWPQVPRIALAAPTGKAAARLAESIKAQKSQLAAAAEIVAAVPDATTTLHRLLGAVPGRSGFRHHARNPLHLDLLVVDEVSMVDVPTMARLLDALPPHARLVLLGDPDQLASVEAGSVLGDICNRERPAGVSPALRAALAALGTAAPAVTAVDAPLADGRVILERSRRFGAASGIGQLARAVNGGDTTEALALLAAGRDDLAWREVGGHGFEQAVRAAAVAEYTPYLRAPDVAGAFAAFGEFRFLCALREGPCGVERVNLLAERALRDQGLISGGERFYAGRPIMVTRNDYALGLFNGDVGLVWPDEGGRLRVFFVQADGSLKRVLPARLPEHETVYAMTVHKSQGSEFARCVVVLPEADAPLLSRELLYTGITRAREAVAVWGPRPVLLSTLARRIERRSGLREALWGD